MPASYTNLKGHNLWIIRAGFLRNVGGSYFPAFPALYYIEPGLRKLCEDLPCSFAGWQEWSVNSDKKVRSIGEFQGCVSRGQEEANDEQ